MSTIVKVLIGSLIVSLITGILATVLMSNSVNHTMDTQGKDAHIPTGALVSYVIMGLSGTVTFIALVMWIVQTIKGTPQTIKQE